MFHVKLYIFLLNDVSCKTIEADALMNINSFKKIVTTCYEILISIL